MSMIFLCYLNLLDPEIEKKAEIKGYLINSNNQDAPGEPLILMIRCIYACRNHLEYAPQCSLLKSAFHGALR